MILVGSSQFLGGDNQTDHWFLEGRYAAMGPIPIPTSQDVRGDQFLFLDLASARNLFRPFA